MAYPKIALHGAVVAVTGGAHGIGKATAEKFAPRGAVVCVGDLDVADSPNAHVLDVTSRDSFGAFVDAVIARHGRIDVLVNNAGVMPVSDFLNEDDAISRTTLDVNVWGLIHGMRAVMPHMIERGRGHVVNVASMAGKLAVPGVRRRRAEIAVPRYLAGWDLVNAAAPEPVMRLGRRLIGDRRALTSVQHDVRAGYEETIAIQAADR